MLLEKRSEQVVAADPNLDMITNFIQQILTGTIAIVAVVGLQMASEDHP